MKQKPPDAECSSPAAPGAVRVLPAGIWALGLGSMCMDISSELIHSVLPLFMAGVLGASMRTIGLIEGVAEATVALTKVFSGAWSDHLRKRKGLLVSGYALAALTKPIFPLSTTIGWVFTARCVDRIGKGIRGAPRDALVAAIAPARLRGAAYGLRQALDAVGSFCGPALAIVCMLWFANDIRAVLWVGVAPAFVAVAILVRYVHEPPRHELAVAGPGPLARAAIRRLPDRYWLVVLLGAVFTLARFSEAFLVLRARDVGLGLAYVPLVLIVMNVCFAALAYPAGAAADRVSRRTLLLLGLMFLVAADLALAAAASPWPVLLGAGLWGLHMALTQGLLSKLVADTAPPALRGTAFGIFSLASGVALLLASLIAGALWSAYGPRATFLAGAGFAAVAALGLLARRPRRAPDPHGSP